MCRILLFLLCCGLSFFSAPASASSDKLIVTRVKGSVLVKKNQKATAGMVLLISDYLTFSHIDEALICIHPDLGKMIFKPYSKLQVHARIPISDLLIPYQGQRNITGLDGIQHFQTLKDSLQLSIQSDLKINQVTTAIHYQLLDQRMKVSAKRPKASPDSVWIFGDTKTNYFLHIAQADGGSKIVAEIEFIEPEEICNELKYMAQLVNADQAKFKKEEYLKRQYKLLSEEVRQVLLTD